MLQFRRELVALVVVMIMTIASVPTGAQTYSEVPESPYAVGQFPQHMTMTHLGEVLFVLNALDDTVSAFLVDGLGLNPVPGTPFSVNSDSAGITADSDFLYVANGGSSNTISVFAIAGNGSLSEVTGSPFSSGGSSPRDLEVVPNQNFLVVTNTSSANFDVFAINRSTGALNQVSGSPFSAGLEPSGIAIHPNSALLVIANCVGDSFSVFDLNPFTGIPSEVIGSPFAHSGCPMSLEFDASGMYLYVDALNSFNGYSVAGNGTLTELPNSPYAPVGFTSYQSVSVSPDGKKVFSTGDDWVTDTSHLVVFDIGVGGDLTQASYSPVQLERESFSVLAHKTDELVYFADSLDDSVTVMAPLVLSGIGEATVDGVAAGEEWFGASTRSFDLNLVDGGTTPATLGVMNNETTLFLGLWVPAGISSGTMGTVFEFDGDADGACADGDDVIMITNGTYHDHYRHGSCFFVSADGDDGGTTDGAGVVDGLNTFFEHSHPLSSGDTGHDFDLKVGDTIGFYLAFTHCNTTTCVTTYFPSSGPPYEARIHISVLPIFSDGFEEGNLSAWSTSSPK